MLSALRTTPARSLLRARPSPAFFSPSSAFSTSSAARKHFLNAKPEDFQAQAIAGDKLTIVDFYAEFVALFPPYFHLFEVRLTLSPSAAGADPAASSRPSSRRSFRRSRARTVRLFPFLLLPFLPLPSITRLAMPPCAPCTSIA
jgi:hypothetical protein